MTLQERLIQCFTHWTPSPPSIEGTSTRDVTLSYSAGPFNFLQDQLLYKIQKKEKLPPWVTVYCGNMTTKVIENLAPSHPHKFRVLVIIKSSAVDNLQELALQYFGDENVIDENIHKINSIAIPAKVINEYNFNGSASQTKGRKDKKWVESQCSEETWTSTESEGTSAACFCMAVRCGYLIQVQQMLKQRPMLISVINNSNGLTPLATAVKKGDTNMVKFLLSAGADIDEPITTGQTCLHLAVLNGLRPVAELLMERGANFKAQDKNLLGIEHCAVDSTKLEIVKFVMDKGGDVHVKDNNGWTPLFRAVCQGATCEIVQELLDRGSDVNLTDRRGLTLTSAARTLKNRLGCSRDSILKLVDTQYQHEKAIENFTRITKKISNINTILSLK